jgi:CheY-like chemotaxis protein
MEGGRAAMKRVLAVDDSRSMLSLIAEALQSPELEVLQAENGEEGLKVILKTAPDLIILDLTMPVMDGFTMLKEVRARGLKTPVILLTASSGKPMIARMTPFGVTDYVLKPFQTEELQLKVKKALASE